MKIIIKKRMKNNYFNKIEYKINNLTWVFLKSGFVKKKKKKIKIDRNFCIN